MGVGVVKTISGSIYTVVGMRKVISHVSRSELIPGCWSNETRFG